jgi:hypothetical protein
VVKGTDALTTVLLYFLERAERELLENAEADQAEEMADVAAEAEEEAVEAARLAAEAAKQVTPFCPRSSLLDDTKE